MPSHFLDHFFVAASAVLPIFVLISIGIFIKRKRWLTETEISHMNRMVFNVFFFCMMFYNMYTADLAATIRPRLILFSFLAVIATLILAAPLVCALEKSNKRRGTILQDSFRSTFVLMGIPLVGSVFGKEALSIPTMMIALIVPLYNILAVIVLEVFRGGKPSLAHITVAVLKNPMIFGALLAATLLLFPVKIPHPILLPIGEIGAATTPVALMLLGASFHFSSAKTQIKPLALTIALRLVIVPAIVLPIAINFGFHGVELMTLVAIFCTPCTSASFTMSEQMGSDAELAANAIVYSSALSCFTVFLWIFSLRLLGFL